jgi:hypothetical protein
VKTTDTLNLSKLYDDANGGKLKMHLSHTTAPPLLSFARPRWWFRLHWLPALKVNPTGLTKPETSKHCACKNRPLQIPDNVLLYCRATQQWSSMQRGTPKDVQCMPNGSRSTMGELHSSRISKREVKRGKRGAGVRRELYHIATVPTNT